MAVRGIKTKIAFNVAILVLLSAIIADLLVVAVVQSMLVRQEVARSRKVLEAIGQSVIATVGNRDADARMVAQLTTQLGATTHLTHIQVADDGGVMRFKKENPVFPGNLAESAAQKDAGAGSVTCQTVPFGLNNCASFIPFKSSRMLRQVSPQACSAIRSNNSAKTVRKTWAWMRWGAW